MVCKNFFSLLPNRLMEDSLRIAAALPYIQAETMEDLKHAIIEAVHCHFDDNQKRNIRLQIIKEEVIAA